MTHSPAFRKSLLRWYDSNRRDLPWRRTNDPWAILVSEIMLQQTRVEAVIHYYERFLQRYPAPAALAEAEEQEALAMWAGLGYYSRIRNLRSAAQQIVAAGEFPRDYEGIRALKGAGDYTAAAVASIAFGLRCGAVDGNVKRVLARVSCGEAAPRTLATELVDKQRPGDFNQAMMELGATVCVPGAPRCGQCPVARLCAARQQGRELEFPVRVKPPEKICEQRTLLLVMNAGRLLLRQREAGSARMAGFWEMPEPSPESAIVAGSEIGRFRHSIVNHKFTFVVREGHVQGRVAGHQWWPMDRLNEIPLSTAAKKAVLCLGKQSHNH